MGLDCPALTAGKYQSTGSVNLAKQSFGLVTPCAPQVLECGVRMELRPIQSRTRCRRTRCIGHRCITRQWRQQLPLDIHGLRLKLKRTVGRTVAPPANSLGVVNELLNSVFHDSIFLSGSLALCSFKLHELIL